MLGGDQLPDVSRGAAPTSTARRASESRASDPATQLRQRSGRGAPRPRDGAAGALGAVGDLEAEARGRGRCRDRRRGDQEGQRLRLRPDREHHANAARRPDLRGIRRGPVPRLPDDRPWIEGAQGDGAIAVVKHFAANNQEGFGGPEANSASPRTARQWINGKRDVVGDRRRSTSTSTSGPARGLLPPVRGGRQAGGRRGRDVRSQQGEWHARVPHRMLLTKVLRDEWGFKGMVLSDHNAAANTAQLLRNGLDFEPFPGTTYGPTQSGLHSAADRPRCMRSRIHVFRICERCSRTACSTARQRERPSRIDSRSTPGSPSRSKRRSRCSETSTDPAPQADS